MKSLKLNYPERMLIRFPPVVPSHPIILSVRISTRVFLKEANAKKEEEEESIGFQINRFSMANMKRIYFLAFH